MATSAFKTLYTQMIQNGGDYDALPKDLLRKDLQVFVKETRPYFLVSDSYFYVPAYFTQAALNDYNSKFPQVNVLDLEGKVIVITKWSLELRKVNSAEVFTSYANVECRLIVHSFKPQLKETLHPTRYPTNLYRDDEFKTTIQAFRHQQVLAASASKSSSMAPLFGGKGNVCQGVNTNAVGEWSFKEGNTKTVALAGSKKRETGSATGAHVKGGAKVTKKAISKGAASKVTSVDALMAVTKTPKGGKASKGKKSATGAHATPDAAGKRSKPATGSAMTVAQYRKFLASMTTKSKKGGKK
jgi:hypothetical protein